MSFKRTSFKGTCRYKGGRTTLRLSRIFLEGLLACFSSPGELYRHGRPTIRCRISWRSSLWCQKTSLKASDNEKSEKKHVFFLKFSWSSPEVLLRSPWGSVAGQVACVLELCWNFEPFVLARTTTYRGELKTHSRHVLGAHVGPTTLGKYCD